MGRGPHYWGFMAKSRMLWRQSAISDAKILGWLFLPSSFSSTRIKITCLVGDPYEQPSFATLMGKHHHEYHAYKNASVKTWCLQQQENFTTTTSLRLRQAFPHVGIEFDHRIGVKFLAEKRHISQQCSVACGLWLMATLRLDAFGVLSPKSWTFLWLASSIHGYIDIIQMGYMIIIPQSTTITFDTAPPGMHKPCKEWDKTTNLNWWNRGCLNH